MKCTRTSCGAILRALKELLKEELLREHEGSIESMGLAERRRNNARLAVARAQECSLGRPKKVSDPLVYEAFKSGLSLREIAKTRNVSHGTIKNSLIRTQLAMKSKAK